MSFFHLLLGFLVNPDLAYILLVVGIFGVIFELTSPGAIAPGVAGAVALIMAFIGFGSLPTNIGGVIFIILAVVLFVVDIKTPTHGFLTAGGIVAFVMGSLLLFPAWITPSGAGDTDSSLSPVVHISILTIVLMTLLVVAFFTFVLGKGIGAMSRRITFGEETIVGGTAIALTACAPEGLVRMAGEQWTARAVEGAIRAGDAVEIVGREGLCLLVRAVTEEGLRF
jgi:membrane-bound serine protease (ClpP class)